MMASLTERTFTADQRKALAKSGAALPDGSYPIENRADLENAIQAMGRGSAPSATIKAHIIKRAKALGATDLLPADWAGSTKEAIHPDGLILEAVATDGVKGREWDVLLIQAGTSKNGVDYSPDVLRKAAPLYEGAKAFADHPTEDENRKRPERSIKDQVGRFRNVEFAQVTLGDGQTVEGLRARFRVVSPWLREQLLEAVDAGEPDFYGLSHNVEADWTPRKQGGRTVKEVRSILRVHSVDVVTDPSAGGRIDRLVASTREGGETVEMTQEQLDELLAKAAEKGAEAARARIDADAAAKAAEAEAAATAAAAAEAAAKAAEGQTDGEKALAAVAEAERRLRATDTRLRVTEALAAVKLSDVGKKAVTTRLLEMAERRVIEDSDIKGLIEETRTYEAEVAQAHANPRGSGGQRIKPGDNEADKFAKRFEGFYLDEDVDGVPRFRGVREAFMAHAELRNGYPLSYLDVNPLEIFEAMRPKGPGALDRSAGRYPDWRRNRNLEEAVSKQLLESLLTADWGDVFADFQYKMLVRAYNTDFMYNDWQKLVSDRESVPDFQTRHWTRIGGFGTLAAVAEGATYPNLTSPTDERVNYAVGKFGGLHDLTMETIVNDQMGAVRRIPLALARAAKRTLHEDIMDLVTTDNPTMDYDSVALYHTNHGNTGTTALSVSGLSAVSRAMRDQTAYNESGLILGEINLPRYLIVPNELEQVARRITNPSDAYTFALSSTPDADQSIDPQYFKDKGIEPIVYDKLTDATDWFTVADPRRVPTIVVGFLNGNDQPELLVQDNPAVGSVFTADKITTKVRIIYGFDVLDHRSMYRQVV